MKIDKHHQHEANPPIVVIETHSVKAWLGGCVHSSQKESINM
jgi:hypothetical protein